MPKTHYCAYPVDPMCEETGTKMNYKMGGVDYFFCDFHFKKSWEDAKRKALLEAKLKD
jgi:YHS domain-containing protein